MSRKQATFTLDPKIKNKWVKALRSGKFKQAIGTLYDSKTNGYCCLGVLCVVAGINKDDLEGWEYPQSAGLSVENDSTTNDCDFWSVQYGKHKDMIPLADLNDDRKLSFAKIADIIEKRVGTH